MTDDIFGEPIFSYSRKQAIEDGVLVDVTETAKEAGIKHPVAVTLAVWERYCQTPEGCEAGQSVSGRLWDVLWLFRNAARRHDGSEFLYKLYVNLPDRGDWQSNEEVPERESGLKRATHRLVTLKAHCGPGDDAAPAITIMLPNED